MNRETWPVLPLPGLTLDYLGNYLAALGLLRLATRKWPTVRACWQADHLSLVNGPQDAQALVDHLVEVASAGSWTEYEKGWDTAQKADTKAKSATNVARWQARDAREQLLPMFHAHLVAGQRLGFNPLLGTGGNAGKRSFSKGRSKAAGALRGGNKAWKPEAIASDALAFLSGSPCQCLADFGAACWFSAANKAFNSGVQRPFRDGQVTPWAMVLACEGLPLLSGAACRRLGTAGKGRAAFPFVVAAAAPLNASDAGRVMAETWLPVWDRPMGLDEVSVLFRRGRAELQGRAATTAPAFSAAIVHCGVDAGVKEFRRFLLLHTTSEQTFESRLADVVPVRDRRDQTMTRVTGAMMRLRDSLPPDRKKGDRWIVAGLRGPVDQALIEFAARPCAENACALTDAAVTALRKVDRNSGHRKKKVRFSLLPPEWAHHLVGSDPLTPEIRLALALASIRPTWKDSSSRPKMVTAPFLGYWLGAEPRGRSGAWMIPESVPFRRVWGGSDLTGNLVAVLRRRLVEEAPKADAPFDGPARVGLADVQAWLDGSMDDVLLTQWGFRFSLVDWTDGRPVIDNLIRGSTGDARGEGVSGTLALFALIKPLFNAGLAETVGATKPVRVGTLSRIAAHLDGGDLDEAVKTARQAYHAVGVELADIRAPLSSSHVSRLLAALMFPVATSQVAGVHSRWRSPKRHESKE
ncbi:MAG: type I-U CRISPR-associated protein Csx17 [Lentisphaerae bacterium RIFOXYB12_FULL_65_16]|nr:MAG: type I-U CRISPR-associated protein Csx17 [Lentisphaerae bacterium RIFOXYA12_64_32]OGV93891.1 MAG: type I-U CRISPR-associated protein Csx17 [Lentisphaerae bacterium RIFOXYB12_FULL_65_16]